MKAVIEKFKDIPGYEGLYQVSDYGCVRSLNYQGKKRIKYLKPGKTSGYLIVGLYSEGKTKSYLVHRLVYEAFVGEIPDGMQIDHINTVRDDNRLSNLRIVTPEENNNNPITRERYLKAHRCAMRKSHNKPILQLDKQTNEVIREWQCARDAYRELGIYHSNISACCNGKLKSSGGFKWKFV